MIDIEKMLRLPYVLPIILAHLEKQEEWHYYFFRELGISAFDLRQFKKVESLVKYHVKSAEENGDYGLLRQGLAEYFREYLTGIWQMVSLVDTDKSLLDYGCGAGEYSRQWLLDNPRGSAVLVDKAPYYGKELFKGAEYKQVDFLKDKGWFSQFFWQFDVVLLAEVLHCKEDADREYLWKSARLMLKTGGSMVIIENVDWAMQLRLSRNGGGGQVLTPEMIKAMIPSEYFILRSIHKINSHYIYRYDKL